MGGAALAAKIKDAFQTQTRSKNVDLMLTFNDFLTHLEKQRESRPAITPREALASFSFNSRAWLTKHPGGNCGALSNDLLDAVPELHNGFIVGSGLPKEYIIAGVPNPGHMAALVPFKNPDAVDDRGYILLEPAFAPPEPIVLRGTEPADLPHPGWHEQLHAYMREDGQEIVIERRPDGKEVSAQEVEDLKLTFRTDEFLNYDNAVTRALLVSMETPRIVARDAVNTIAGYIVVNLQKNQVEMTMGKERAKPVPFSEIGADGAWLASAPGGAAAFLELLHLPSAAYLAQRVHQVVREADTLKGLRAWHFADLGLPLTANS